jgi:hypothetical protein
MKSKKMLRIAIYCFISAIYSCLNGALGLFKQLKVLYYTMAYAYQLIVEKDVENQHLV